MGENQYLTVSQFNRNMKSHFDNNPNFRNVYVKGEVSGVYTSPIGNFYFKLKDKRSVINCIIQNRFMKNMDFEIKDGMKLLVIANVTIYPPHGKYQLDVRSVTEDGLGKLYVKLQQLKEKLAKEGLFDKEHKKQLSRFPKKIGVVTSTGGSVIHDIIKTVNQKWPYCEILIFPSAVQGPGATTELVKQIKRADSYGLDVLIVGRGGGSLEDIWSFNEEIVVRAIFNAKTPIISAVGHENDITLTDLVSDRRASTPTMAASLAIEDRNIVKKDVNQLNSRLLNFMSSKINDFRQEFNFILSKSLFADSKNIFASKKNRFEILNSRFEKYSSVMLNNNKHMLENIKTEYVIRHPCKIQFDQSRSNLEELNNRLIDSMKKILKNNQSTLDNATNKFEFYSQNLLQSKRHDLEMVERVVMSNPCQNQIESSKISLKVAHEKLVNSIDVRLGSDKKDLELVSNSFRNVSDKLILEKSYDLDAIRNLGIFKDPNKLVKSKRHDLEMLENVVMSNPCQNQIDTSKTSIKVFREKLVSNLDVRLGSDKKDLELVSNSFRNVSGKLILEKSYDLDAVKNLVIFKDPNNLLMSKKFELANIKNEKVLKDPYLILDSSKADLEIYREKLDKINQVMDIKKEQEKQKSMYIKIIIIAIITFMMIIILLIFGGI